MQGLRQARIPASQVTYVSLFQIVMMMLWLRIIVLLENISVMLKLNLGMGILLMFVGTNYAT